MSDTPHKRYIQKYAFPYEPVCPYGNESMSHRNHTGIYNCGNCLLYHLHHTVRCHGCLQCLHPQPDTCLIRCNQPSLIPRVGEAIFGVRAMTYLLAGRVSCCTELSLLSTDIISVGSVFPWLWCVPWSAFLWCTRSGCRGKSSSLDTFWGRVDSVGSVMLDVDEPLRKEENFIKVKS